MKHSFTALFATLLAAAIMVLPGILRAGDSVVGVDWKRVEGNPPPYAPRFEHRGVVFDDKMVIAGGHRAAGWLADVWASGDGRDWEALVTNAPWPARAQHGMIVHDGKIWIVGGVGVELYNDVWSSHDGRRWELATENAQWPPRTDFGLVSHNGKLFVIGGHGPHERLNDVWASTDGVTWEPLTLDAPWQARSHHAAIAHRGEILLLGGAHFDYGENEYVFHGDIWESQDGAEWSLVTETAQWSPRKLHRVVSMNDRLWLFGGDDRPRAGRLLADSWHSGDGKRWFKLTEDAGIEERIYFVLLPFKDSLWVLNGMDPSWGIFTDVKSNYVSEGEIPFLAPFRR